VKSIQQIRSPKLASVNQYLVNDLNAVFYTRLLFLWIIFSHLLSKIQEFLLRLFTAFLYNHSIIPAFPGGAPSSFASLISSQLRFFSRMAAIPIILNASNVQSCNRIFWTSQICPKNLTVNIKRISFPVLWQLSLLTVALAIKSKSAAPMLSPLLHWKS